MIKNIIKYLLTTFLSFMLVYIICDMLILPYVFYVKETTVPNVVNHDISTGKVLIDNKNLEMRIQYVPSSKGETV